MGMKKNISKKGTFFLKYFLIFSAIVLSSFMLIGVTLMVFVANFLSTNILDDTKENSVEHADATTEIL